MRNLRPRLTYANVVSTLCLFLLLGGTATAATVLISSNAQVGKGTISGHQPPRGKHPNLIAGSVTGADVNEQTLGTVPNANKLDGLDSAALKVRCPGATSPFAGSCVETSLRPAADWGTATQTCAGAGRRMPTPDELFALLASTPGLQPAEMSGTSYGDANGSGIAFEYTQVRDFANGGGGVIGTTVTAGNPTVPAPYRCVAMPSN